MPVLLGLRQPLQGQVFHLLDFEAKTNIVTNPTTGCGFLLLFTFIHKLI